MFGGLTFSYFCVQKIMHSLHKYLDIYATSELLAHQKLVTKIGMILMPVSVSTQNSDTESILK